MKEPEVNTYFIDYIPQVRYGVKITGGNLAEEALYLDGEPIEHQIKGDSNLYDFCLPVAGYVDTPLAIKIQPYQVLYNYCINQIVNILENEIGTFFLADVNLIPSQYKGMSEDVAGVFAELMEAAKLREPWYWILPNRIRGELYRSTSSGFTTCPRLTG